jgi:tRNA(fMet)-specific endonuclease VapC
MPNYLLDTDICVYVRRNDPPKVRKRFEQLGRDDAAISVITYGELAYGTARHSDPPVARAALERFVRLFSVLSLPAEAAGVYGEIRAALAIAGRQIGPNDLWIASHAPARDLVLVTNNEHEFRRVPNLRVENWAK